MENSLLQIFVLFVAGLVASRLVKFVKLPAVTGYLIAGLLVGPFVFNIVNIETIDHLGVFSAIALAFIAFSIGNEFKMSYFKKVGMTPIVIAFMEAIAAMIVVAISIYLITDDIAFSVMVGSLAAATAPAATIMVIRQYKAKGSVTSTLLSVVAIDDAAALICFGFALAFTNSLKDQHSSVLLMLLDPFKEILFAVLVGIIIGLLLCYVLRFFHSRGNFQAIIISAILLAIGVSDIIGISSLMVCMVLGATFTNISGFSSKMVEVVDRLTPSLFILFFVISGAELNPSIIPTIKILGVVYIFTRIIGKYLGAYFGAVVSKADANVRRYLGPCLIPQAGVAIGLSLIAEQAVPAHGSTIRAMILCATLVYELVGPFVTKLTLQKAGEIDAQA